MQDNQIVHTGDLLAPSRSTRPPSASPWRRAPRPSFAAAGQAVGVSDRGGGRGPGATGWSRSLSGPTSVSRRGASSSWCASAFIRRREPTRHGRCCRRVRGTGAAGTGRAGAGAPGVLGPRGADNPQIREALARTRAGSAPADLTHTTLLSPGDGLVTNLAAQHRAVRVRRPTVTDLSLDSKTAGVAERALPTRKQPGVHQARGEQAEVVLDVLPGRKCCRRGSIVSAGASARTIQISARPACRTRTRTAADGWQRREALPGATVVRHGRGATERRALHRARERHPLHGRPPGRERARLGLDPGDFGAHL